MPFVAIVGALAACCSGFAGARLVRRARASRGRAARPTEVRASARRRAVASTLLPIGSPARADERPSRSPVEPPVPQTRRRAARSARPAASATRAAEGRTSFLTARTSTQSRAPAGTDRLRAAARTRVWPQLDRARTRTLSLGRCRRIRRGACVVDALPMPAGRTGKGSNEDHVPVVPGEVHDRRRESRRQDRQDQVQEVRRDHRRAAAPTRPAPPARSRPLQAAAMADAPLGGDGTTTRARARPASSPRAAPRRRGGGRVDGQRHRRRSAHDDGARRSSPSTSGA